MYRCEAVSIPGFIQQVAVAYIANGYRFYVTGCIPPVKDLKAIDEKLIQRYEIDCSKWVRWRRKNRGLANVQYLRYRRFFILLASQGPHEFFRRETQVQDIRRKPIQCFGYSVGCYQGRRGSWHPSVRIERALFQALKKEFLECATSESFESLYWRFAHLPFEPYSPVRRQLLMLLASVNRARAQAAVEVLPFEALRLRRRPQAPFGDVKEQADSTLS